MVADVSDGQRQVYLTTTLTTKLIWPRLFFSRFPDQIGSQSCLRNLLVVELEVVPNILTSVAQSNKKQIFKRKIMITLISLIPEHNARRARTLSIAIDVAG